MKSEGDWQFDNTVRKRAWVRKSGFFKARQSSLPFMDCITLAYLVFLISIFLLHIYAGKVEKKEKTLVEQRKNKQNEAAKEKKARESIELQKLVYGVHTPVTCPNKRLGQ